LTLYLDNMGIALKKKSTEMISTNCMWLQNIFQELEF
jgi:hypothetical protein